MAKKPGKKQPDDRDERGRFKSGNRGGPGGSRRRAFELRRAAEEAVSPEHVAAMIRKALTMALQGDVAAMRFVGDRIIGRPLDTPAEPEPIELDLPRLRSVKDCDRAIERVVDGICKGTISHESAKLLTDAIQARLRAIEVRDLDNRLLQLEQAADAIRKGHMVRAPDPRFE